MVAAVLARGGGRGIGATYLCEVVAYDARVDLLLLQDAGVDLQPDLLLLHCLHHLRATGGCVCEWQYHSRVALQGAGTFWCCFRFSFAPWSAYPFGGTGLLASFCVGPVASIMVLLRRSHMSR